MTAMTEQKAAALLRSWDNVLILTHRQPDGDTVGSAAGLCAALRQMGKRACIAPNEGFHGLFSPYLENLLAPADFVPQAVVTVDVASAGMLPPSLTGYLGRIDLNIDHHPSNDLFGTHNYVDPGCAACGELVYGIVRELNEITPQVALPLYMALSTDTGCFVYGNTTPKTHRIAAELMETGIKYEWVNKRHFRTKSLKRLRMESKMVEALQSYDGGTIVLTSVTLDMMRQLGTTNQDLEDVSAFIGQVEGAQVAVTLREMKAGEWKISLRTQGGLNASDVCALLGGGGHAAAAGCTVEGTMEQVSQAILTAIRRVQNG